MATSFRRFARLSEHHGLLLFGRGFDSWHEISTGIPEVVRQWLWCDDPRLLALAPQLLNNKRAMQVFIVWVALSCWVKQALWALVPKLTRRSIIRFDSTAGTPLICRETVGLRWFRLYWAVVEKVPAKYKMTDKEYASLIDITRDPDSGPGSGSIVLAPTARYRHRQPRHPSRRTSHSNS